MPKKKSSWNSPEIIVALSGLIISLIFNILQYSYNDKISAQAERDSKKTALIQRQRDGWVEKLRSELNTVTTDIVRLENELRISEPSLTLINDRDREHATASYHAIEGELSALRTRKADLEQQINSFLSPK